MRAVLWDLDGTLLDPAGSIRSTIDLVLQEEGLAPFDPETKRLIGMPLRQILALRTPDEGLIERMVHRYREVFGAVGPGMVRWQPGMRDLLDALAARGMEQAIVTTKGQEEAAHLLSALGVRHVFSVVIGDDDQRPLKPDPAPVIAACDALGVEPGHAFMVGDTTYDIEAGRDAGARPVGVAWGHGDHERLLAAGAETVAPNAAALARALNAPRPTP